VGYPAFFLICRKSGVLSNMPEIRRFDRFAGFPAYCQICRKSGVLPIMPEIDSACVMGE
jgi:hypothetical protein